MFEGFGQEQKYSCDDEAAMKRLLGEIYEQHHTPPLHPAPSSQNGDDKEALQHVAPEVLVFKLGLRERNEAAAGKRKDKRVQRGVS